jgi:hypothetical protein
MKKLLVFAASILLSASSFAHLGNGSSGGGNIFGNQLNPWFIQNTTDVTYCVKVAPEFGNVTHERVLELIDSSFKYWKKIFENRYASDFFTSLKVELGTQNFHYVKECSNETDIQFLLGALTPQQINSIPNLHQVLGLARRTSYDEVNLKGKGFIYIAPESGPLRPRSSNLHATPWTTHNNSALKNALLHEIGHIFGFQDDYYSTAGLMSASWIEFSTRKDSYFTGNDVPSPLGCNDNFDVDIEMFYPKSFETDTQIIKFGIKTFKGYMQLTMNDEEYGSIKLSEDALVLVKGEAAVSLYVTKAQQVFKDLHESQYYTSFPVLYAIESARRENETLWFASGEKLNVFMQFDERCAPTIGTVKNGKVIFDFIPEFIDKKL